MCAGSEEKIKSKVSESKSVNSEGISRDDLLGLRSCAKIEKIIE